MLSLIIFDCDGVLFDSRRANVAYYNAVLGRLGLPPMTSEWEERAHVLSSPQLYDAMFGAGSALAAAARQAAAETDYAPFYRFMKPVPGLYDLLGTLKQSYRLAMATNRGSTLEGVVREFRLDRFLDLTVGVRDVERPKPHPDMIESCLAHFAIAPQAAVYVGDAETDRAAAHAARVHFLAVGDGAAAADSMRDLRELPGRLAALERSLASDGRAHCRRGGTATP